MVPPPVHMCNGLTTRPADAAHKYCEICEVIRYVAAPVRRRFNFSSYSFVQNVISSSVITSLKFHQNRFSIRAKRTNADVGMEHRDDIIAFTAPTCGGIKCLIVVGMECLPFIPL